MLKLGKFRTIVADPPWCLQDSSWDGSSNVQSYRIHPPYPTMSLGEIKALPVSEILEREAHLYLWCLNSILDWGFEVCRAWGCEPKTVLTWVKTKKSHIGIAMGMGHYYRNCTEQVIFAVRGNLQVKRHDVLGVFFAPRRRHSEKPGIFYKHLVERMSPPPYLEMFARAKREGWEVWGFEADKTSRNEEGAWQLALQGL